MLLHAVQIVVSSYPSRKFYNFVGILQGEDLRKKGGEKKRKNDGVVPDCRKSASVVGRQKDFSFDCRLRPGWRGILATGGSGPVLLVLLVQEVAQVSGGSFCRRKVQILVVDGSCRKPCVDPGRSDTTRACKKT
jgi:hypothetical protein